MSKVIICGSRDWSDYAAIIGCIRALRDRYENLTIIHGGCRGADEMAATACDKLGIRQKAILADWVGRGRVAGPERNKRMLEMNPLSVIGFKDYLARKLDRGGTENMLKIALLAGIPCFWRSLHKWHTLRREDYGF